MTTLQIDVPDSVAEESQRIAEATGVSLSELAADALEKAVRMHRLGELVAWAEEEGGPLTEEEIEAAGRELRGDA
jgi:hypothetical protein